MHEHLTRGEFRPLLLKTKPKTTVSSSPAPTKSPAGEVEVCSTSLRFTVTHNMAPLSRLLVYYVRENGEGITDSIQVPIQPSYENKVSVSLSSNETKPGDLINLSVRGERGSCTCVATVDKSVYLLKPGFRLTTEKVTLCVLYVRAFLCVNS
uniref:Alpha-2-macroglobulin bait region domain-containing protein n=1 Tax=Callorhinchus milii TaxID=7868 RepID=A0A4W3H4D0_CALMI